MGHELPYFYRDVRDAHIRQTERFNWSKANSYRGRFSLRTFCNSISLCGFLRNAIARMIGGVAFGSALILAPTYIAEIVGQKIAVSW